MPKENKEPKKRFNNIFISTLSGKKSNLQAIEVLNSFFRINHKDIHFYVDYNIDKEYGRIQADNITSKEALQATALCFGFYYGKNFPRLAFHNKEQ